MFDEKRLSESSDERTCKSQARQCAGFVVAIDPNDDERSIAALTSAVLDAMHAVGIETTV